MLDLGPWNLYTNIAHETSSCLVVLVLFNPFRNTPFWDRHKFKEAADDNWNVANKDSMAQIV